MRFFFLQNISAAIQRTDCVYEIVHTSHNAGARGRESYFQNISKLFSLLLCRLIRICCCPGPHRDTLTSPGIAYPPKCKPYHCFFLSRSITLLTTRIQVCVSLIFLSVIFAGSIAVLFILMAQQKCFKTAAFVSALTVYFIFCMLFTHFSQRDIKMTLSVTLL